MSQWPEKRVTPAAGHNSGVATHAGEEVGAVERWTKKRVFVRALEGTYGDLVKDLFSQPRVFRTRDMKWKGGPAMYDKFPVNPQGARVTQAIETHIDVLSPGSYGQKHGHMNSAVFYVLKGRGYDIHDGRRIDWEAGDALIVENACVHQHLNADPDNEAIVVVAKAKPLSLFMHLLFQKVVEYPPTEPMPGHEDYKPPADF
jgi:quercetin dioxygenase-like cupin family protein